MKKSLSLWLVPVFFSLLVLVPNQTYSAELMDVCFEYTGSGGGSLTLNFNISPQGIVPLNGFRTLGDGTTIPVSGSAVVSGDSAKLGLILIRASETTGTVAWEVSLTFTNGVWKGSGYYTSLVGAGEGNLSGEMVMTSCSSISSLGALQQSEKSTASPEDGYPGLSANAPAR